MIFVTVGTQFGFDRMVTYVDQWLAQNPKINAFAQIAEGKYKPHYMPHNKYLKAEQYTAFFSQADVIVAHAGMGTILSALKQNKKLIVMPREYAQAEHRNDHQKNAIPWLKTIQGLQLATGKTELFNHLDTFATVKDFTSKENNINYNNREHLQSAIYDIIRQHCS